MNQILSVEMPPKKSTKKTGYNKASIKSIIIFFSAVLIIFGVTLIGISVLSMLDSKNNNNTTIATNSPRIDVTQNATELEIEILCTSEISNIEYNWENREVEKVDANGRNDINLKVDIPSGTNIFKIKVTDIDGRTSEYSKEYIGAKEPNVTLIVDPNNINNIIVAKCEESQIIKYMSYYYDDEQEKRVEINNASGTIEINAKEGEHNLTIKVGYEDGTVGKISKIVYAPVLQIGTNGGLNYSKFIINASDTRGIDKVIINFNGKETVEQVGSESYSKEVALQQGQPGTNKLIVTIYNKEGMRITKRIWDKNRQN